VSRAGRQVDKIILDEINNFSEKMLETQVAIARAAGKLVVTRAEYIPPPSYDDLDSLMGHKLKCCDGCGQIFDVIEVNITGTALKLRSSIGHDVWYQINEIMKMSVVVKDELQKQGRKKQ